MYAAEINPKNIRARLRNKLRNHIRLKTFLVASPIGQISRLKECEKMIVAMEMSKWLNDSPTYLQCVVQTYGLIAPILQANVDSEPVFQVTDDFKHIGV